MCVRLEKKKKKKKKVSFFFWYQFLFTSFSLRPPFCVSVVLFSCVSLVYTQTHTGQTPKRKYVGGVNKCSQQQQLTSIGFFFVNLCVVYRCHVAACNNPLFLFLPFHPPPFRYLFPGVVDPSISAPCVQHWPQLGRTDGHTSTFPWQKSVGGKRSSHPVQQDERKKQKLGNWWCW